MTTAVLAARARACIQTRLMTAARRPHVVVNCHRTSEHAVVSQYVRPDRMPAGVLLQHLMETSNSRLLIFCSFLVLFARGCPLYIIIVSFNDRCVLLLVKDYTCVSVSDRRWEMLQVKTNEHSHFLLDIYNTDHGVLIINNKLTRVR